MIVEDFWPQKNRYRLVSLTQYYTEFTKTYARTPATRLLNDLGYIYTVAFKKPQRAFDHDSDM